MAKPNFQDILLKKGDKIALGVGAALVGGLSLWGVANFATADSPTSLVKQFDGKAVSLKSQVAAEGADATELPAWVMKGADKVAIDPAQFALAGSPFEAVDRPDTLRNNPKVLLIDDAQFDYLRFPMQANDIKIDADGNVTVSVKVAAPKGETDPAKLKANLDGINRRQGVKSAPPVRPPAPVQPGGRSGPPGGMPGGGMPGGGMPGGGMPGGGMPGGGMPGGRGMPGGPGGPGGMGDGSGGLGGGGERTDQTIRYVTPAQAAKEGLTLAETVFPLRAVVVTATFPVKKQIEEIRQALRAVSNAQAVEFASVGGSPGPVFAGFEVDRRTMVAGGAWSDWAAYDHEGEYLSKIYSRAISTVPDAGYLAYFVPPFDQKMVYPLPVFADGLGEYRKITMRSVVDQIGKLNQLNAPKLTPSDLEKKLGGQGGINTNPFAPLTGAGGGGSGGGLSGGAGMMAPGMGGMSGGAGAMAPGSGGPLPPGMPRPGGGPGSSMTPGSGSLVNQPNQPDPVGEIIDHTLLRFIDSDIKPGFSYQYRVKVKMRNPNFNKAGLVSKPADAKVEVLEGPWQVIPQVFAVPTDDFLYAHDSAEYVDSSTKLVETYGKESAFKKFLEVDEVSAGRRAVVEVQQWKETLRMEGGKSEPVGTWVVAKMPVAPGEYIGKRQFLELPLWSGGLGNYVLRELAGGLRIAGIKDQKHQPRGWPLNLRTASVLIDFEGGKTKARVNDREVADDAESELLILQPDGKLVVRNSGVDTINRERKERDTVWTEWVARVKERRDVAMPGAGGAVPPGGGGFTRPGGN